MPILPGMRLTADRLNRLKPTVYTAVGSDDQTVALTAAIPGCAVTFTTTAASTRLLVEGTASFTVTAATAAGNYCSAQLLLDGSLQSGFGRWGNTVTGTMGSPSQIWDLNVGPGTHTVALASARTGSTGTYTAVAQHAHLQVSVYEDIE